MCRSLFLTSFTHRHDAPCALFFRADLTFHSVASLLLTLTVLNKGHFLFLWYIALIFSLPQILLDLWTLMLTFVIGRKQRGLK